MRVPHIFDGWGSDRKDDHVCGMVLVPHLHDLTGGLADVGTVVQLASERAVRDIQPGNWKSQPENTDSL